MKRTVITNVGSIRVVNPAKTVDRISCFSAAAAVPRQACKVNRVDKKRANDQDILAIYFNSEVPT